MSRAYRCLPHLSTVTAASAVTALLFVANSGSPVAAQTPPEPDVLATTKGIDVINGSVEIVDHNGRRALRLLRATDAPRDSSMLAILPVEDFHNGTIEIDVAGSPRPGADDYARGFIGVAFRMQGRGEKTEEFYLRPTNGRAADPDRRGHAVQYVSEPEFGWERLRKEHPGVYEASADLVPDAWTRMKIVVEGTSAQLYLNDSAQPCLTVNDLKLGDSHGGIALWSHETTDGYFSNLKITRN